MKAPISDIEELMEAHLNFAKIPHVRELMFAKGVGRRWRFDFAFPDRMIALEVEGGSWVNGAHNRPSSFEGDCEKYSEAAIAGWRVIRVTGAQVRNGQALNFVIRALEGK